MTRQRKEQDKLYYEQNSEKIKADKKDYYARNKEEIKARVKAHADANKEQILEQKRAYYAANKDRIKARVKKYKADNKAKMQPRINARERAQRALKRNPADARAAMVLVQPKLKECQRMRFKALRLPCGDRPECFLHPRCRHIPKDKKEVRL